MSRAGLRDSPSGSPGLPSGRAGPGNSCHRHNPAGATADGTEYCPRLRRAELKVHYVLLLETLLFSKPSVGSVRVLRDAALTDVLPTAAGKILTWELHSADSRHPDTLDSHRGLARASTCTFSYEEEGAVGSELPTSPCWTVLKCFFFCTKVTLLPLVLVSLC